MVGWVLLGSSLTCGVPVEQAIVTYRELGFVVVWRCFHAVHISFHTLTMLILVLLIICKIQNVHYMYARWVTSEVVFSCFAIYESSVRTLVGVLCT